jgi:hypothetical protein
MQGYLNKKSEKNKKWKSLYFVLLVDGTDTHLYFYDNPKVCKCMLLFLFRSVKHQTYSLHQQKDFVCSIFK